MPEVVPPEKEADSPPHRRRLLPSFKRAAKQSASGTKNVLKGSLSTASKAVKLQKEKDPKNKNQTQAPVSPGDYGGCGSGISLLASSFDSVGVTENANNATARTITAKTIEVGPLLEFLTADATIIMILILALASIMTFRNWHALFDSQAVPLSVAGSWVLLAYAVGQVFSIEKLKSSHTVILPPSSASSTVSDTTPTNAIPSQAGRDREITVEEKTMFKSHSLFWAFVGPKQREKIKFKRVGDSIKRTLKYRPPWSTLQSNREKVQPWETNVDPTKDPNGTSDLMSLLLRKTKFRRTTVAPLQSPQEAEGEAAPIVSTNFGAFDLSKATADSLDNFVIEPILKLRGMDVFLTEDLECDVSSHPWLIKQGLRNVPTMVVNTITQWGHILVYFEMPEWVNAGFDNIVEEKSDEEDVKALKRFLNGDTEYRNERLKVIPSIVDGPLAVKVLAPPKKEMLLNCAFLPVSWRQYASETTSKGRKLCPALEVTLDCLSNRAMRSMAGIVKRNLQRLSIDMAAVIGKPITQEEDEPQACLGLWRLDHVDIASCPQFPHRFAKEASKTGQDPDVFRAAQLMVSMNEKD